MPDSIGLPDLNGGNPGGIPTKYLLIGGAAGLGLLVFLMTRGRQTTGGTTTPEGQLTLNSAVALGSIQNDLRESFNALSFWQQEQDKANEGLFEGLRSVGGLVTHDIRAGDLQAWTEQHSLFAEKAGYGSFSNLLQARSEFRGTYDKLRTDVGLSTWIPSPEEIQGYNVWASSNEATTTVSNAATGAARGGPAIAGHIFRVNERGVGELFVPNVNGTILPNERIRVLASAEDVMDQTDHILSAFDAGGFWEKNVA